MPQPLSMLVMTRGEVDLFAELVECVRNAYGDEYTEPPEDAQLRAMLAVPWSRVLTGDAACTLHRVTFTPDSGEDGDDAGTDELIRDFCKEVRDLAGDAIPGISHVARFHSPAQLRHHEGLYRDIYEIEMRLREVLTFIFLDKSPARPYGFLDGNAIKLQGDKSNQSPEYLKAHDENQLFHILFDDYDDLNQNPVAKPTDLLPLIRTSISFDKLREAVSEAPIKPGKHADFLLALSELVPTIEAVRNAIAHNRDLSIRARENYDLVRPRLNKAIDDFWASEVDHTAAVTTSDGIAAEDGESVAIEVETNDAGIAAGADGPSRMGESAESQVQTISPDQLTGDGQ